MVKVGEIYLFIKEIRQNAGFLKTKKQTKRVQVVSRNFLFFIIGLIAVVLAYFANSSLVVVLEMVTTERMPRDFLRLLQNSDLVSFAGFTSLFGLSFFLLYLIFPVFYVWYHMNSARRRLAELPLMSNLVRRTDKKTFLSALKGLGFIEKLAESYGPYLMQGPEEMVSPEALKKTRLGRSKDQKIKISPVSVTVPAEVIFNEASLVSDNLLLGFFPLFARAMVAAGIVCLGISVMSLSLNEAAAEGSLLSALQPGMIALLYLLMSAIIMASLSNLMSLVLGQNAGMVARKINGLFHQNGWQQDLDKITTSLEGNSAMETLERVLQKSLDKPMKEISNAVKALASQQEKKLDNILSRTLDNFANDLVKKSGADMGSLNKTLRDAALAADQMKKQFTSANTEFSKQMDKQSTAIARHLTDMQKTLGNSEKTTQAASEKIISSLAKEVENTYKKFSGYVDSSLKKLDEKQIKIETSANDKDGILKDLHATAKDLATISNASGMLLERFITLATELDGVLRNIKENGGGHYSENTEKRDKLKQAMVKLKKINKDRINELPDM